MGSIKSGTRQELPEGWKKDLAAALKAIGLIDERYTGKLTLTFVEGGISEIERTERLK